MVFAPQMFVQFLVNYVHYSSQIALRRNSEDTYPLERLLALPELPVESRAF